MKCIRKTKIVATLGPATNNKEKISSLISSGVNIFRINASHGTLEEHKRTIDIIKTLREECNTPIGILIDLQGPKIRVGKLENGEPIELIEGNKITITSQTVIGNLQCISTNYDNLAKDVKPGDKILLNDGVITLEVTEIINNDVVTTIIDGGELREHKGVNIPGTTNSLSSVSEKDKTDIKFAVENNVDFIGLSFVRTAKDIQEVKYHIHSAGGDIPVIAKIEKPQALDNINEIINAADGIMVARGDLGVELAPHKVPLAQKKVITLSKASNKFVITATQMLESMVNNPIPTRAEASDVANAILDGTDAVMLSEETSMGKFPDKAVQMMASIAIEIECNSNIAINKSLPMVNSQVTIDSHAIARTVIDMCDELKPAAIIAFTGSGFSARLLSSFKPCVPVIAFTHKQKICRQINISWAVTPYVLDVDFFNSTLTEEFDTILKNKTDLQSGDKVIVIGGLPYLISGITNFIRIHVIK